MVPGADNLQNHAMIGRLNFLSLHKWPQSEKGPCMAETLL